MNALFEKMSGHYYKTPIISTLLVSLVISLLLGIIGWVTSSIKYSSSLGIDSIFSIMVGASFIVLPAVLTIQNFILLFIKPKSAKKEKAIKRWEVAAIVIGTIFSMFYLPLTGILFQDWQVQLYNSELHTPIATYGILTIGVIVVVAITGYIILRFSSLEKLPPLFAVLCISALYLGIAIALLWCIQIFSVSDSGMLLLCLLPINCILIAIRTIRQVVVQHVYKIGNVSYKNHHIVKLLSNTSNWPWLAFLAAVPLLGIIVAVLLIFGQEPDSFIKAWTETADWNMSQKVAPQNIFKDQHYLCTVAAGGHREIVKPIRTGKRHGHRVVVNRQLCIANAFEQLLEERLPRFHRLVRSTYDNIGYPIAKHIKSPFTADVIYAIMKPLEWLFLVTLYLFDVNPENRIAVQYPHSDPYSYQTKKG